MPEKETLERAKKDKREGKHGARSAKQAIAIGLSKARRAGVDLPPPKEGTTSEETRKNAEQALEAGHQRQHKPSATRSRATKRALKREPRSTVSRRAMAKQAKSAARRRSPTQRSAAARKAANTKGAAGRKAAARKAARTRARTR